MSTLRVNAIQNTSGVQLYLARAWVNFDGTTGTIRASGNVSSVTRIGTGQYTISFATAFADTSYAVCFGAALNNTYTGFVPYQDDRLGTKSTTQVFVAVWNGSGYTDSTQVYASVFR